MFESIFGHWKMPQTTHVYYLLWTLFLNAGQQKWPHTLTKVFFSPPPILQFIFDFSSQLVPVEWQFFFFLVVLCFTPLFFMCPQPQPSSSSSSDQRWWWWWWRRLIGSSGFFEWKLTHFFEGFPFIFETP